MGCQQYLNHRNDIYFAQKVFKKILIYNKGVVLVKVFSKDQNKQGEVNIKRYCYREYGWD